MNNEHSVQQSRAWRVSLAVVLVVLVGSVVAQQDRIRIHMGLLQVRLVPLYERSKPDIGQTEIVEELEQTVVDKHALAEGLLGLDSGSMVAEGMVMLVRYRHPDAESLLGAHLDDARFNHWLMLNDELASDCLKASRLRKKRWLTPEEEAVLAELAVYYEF